MRIDLDDHGHSQIATFDIETTHWNASKGELVSVGLGIHDRGTSLSDGEYKLLHRSPDRDEATLIKEAYEWLDATAADCLVSFNGRGFDFEFCADRLEQLGISIDSPALHTSETHLDLFHDDRKDLADQRGQKWPSLEEVLEAYGESPEPLMWNGAPLTNKRFGQELGPAMLKAVADDDQETADQLQTTIEVYLQDDLEKNLRIFYYDIGELTPPVAIED